MSVPAWYSALMGGTRCPRARRGGANEKVRVREGQTSASVRKYQITYETGAKPKPSTHEKSGSSEANEKSGSSD